MTNISELPGKTLDDSKTFEQMTVLVQSLVQIWTVLETLGKIDNVLKPLGKMNEIQELLV